MKAKGIIRLVVMALAVLLPAYSFATDLGAARLSVLQGEVYLYAEDTEETAEAPASMPIIEGNRIEVGEDGRAEIHIRGGTYVRLDSNTYLDVLALGDDEAAFYLESGRAYVNDADGGITRITVETSGDSVITLYDESISGLEVLEDGKVEVSVISGHAYGESGGIDASAAEDMRLVIGGGMVAKYSGIPRYDEWFAWNAERDDILYAEAESRRYLPEELDEYAYDLERDGSWVYTVRHGYVWRPAVALTIGWAPYRHGRWVWSGGDYVWVSYERWGWVPYHYGRWVHLAGTGWGWVPPRHRAVYWGPGFVAWTRTSTYVSWVPLAPGEIYYGYGYYGRNSVNLVNLSININFGKIVYRNVRVHNSVTVVKLDSFHKRRHVHVRLKHNPFKKHRVAAGPPHSIHKKYVLNNKKARRHKVAHKKRAARYAKKDGYIKRQADKAVAKRHAYDWGKHNADVRHDSRSKKSRRDVHAKKRSKVERDVRSGHSGRDKSVTKRNARKRQDVRQVTAKKRSEIKARKENSRKERLIAKRKPIKRRNEGLFKRNNGKEREAPAVRKGDNRRRPKVVERSNTRPNRPTVTRGSERNKSVPKQWGRKAGGPNVKEVMKPARNNGKKVKSAASTNKPRGVKKAAKPAKGKKVKAGQQPNGEGKPFMQAERGGWNFKGKKRH